MSEWATALVSGLLGIFSGLLALLSVVLFVEVVAAAVWSRRGRAYFPPTNDRPRIAVLVPAHNESSGVLPTIHDVRNQMRAGDRILVVADNCSDDTAIVARAAGAEVIERNDPAKVGKGYALDWGIRDLQADPPGVVIVIDADCRLLCGTLDRLAEACAATDGPVQALNMMTAPARAPVNYQIAEFAWRVKNWVRPLGLRALGLPCQLMGTGMAFPWDVIRSAKLATGHIVEDLELGLELAAGGRAPLFCPSAMVTSEFPQSVRAAHGQRRRWEHGHIALILTLAPALVVRALTRGNWALLSLALDIAVPPLGLLGLLTVTAAVVGGVAAAFGLSPVPVLVSGIGLALLAFAVLLSWLTFARDILTSAALLQLGPFVLGKLVLYCRLLRRGPVSQWTRTDRK